MTEEERDAIWEDYLDKEYEFKQLRTKIFQLYSSQTKNNKIKFLKKDLLDIRKRFFLYEIIESLSVDEQILLSEELFPLAIMIETKRSFNPAEKIVLSWGEDWILSNLEKITKITLEKIKLGVFRYMDLAEFYNDVIIFNHCYNIDFAKLLLEEAISHSDENVREVGKELKTSLDFDRK
jgi:hypothetical protein